MVKMSSFRPLRRFSTDWAVSSTVRWFSSTSLADFATLFQVFRGNFYYPHEQRGCAMSLHTHRTESRAADPYRFAEPRIRIHKTEEEKQERCRESTYLRDNSVRIAEIKMLLFTIINALLLLLLITMLPL